MLNIKYPNYGCTGVSKVKMACTDSLLPLGQNTPAHTHTHTNTCLYSLIDARDHFTVLWALGNNP